MSIETTVTRAWQRQTWWLWLLWPISCLYGLIIRLRQQAYKRGWLTSYRAPIAVMVIGNISVGGSGKTPLIIELVNHLQQQGVKVGVISRGYGGDSSQMPALVDTQSIPRVVGDEPCLIVNMTRVPMAVCANRQQAITTLLDAHPDLQLIIADDGLQHYALQRDIEWIVVDAARGFGNEQLLPTGFLREPMSRLQGATVIYHDKPTAEPNTSHYDSRLTMHLQPNDLHCLWQPVACGSQMHDDETKKPVPQPVPKKGNKVYALSGIGYPQRFFDTLSSLGFVVEGHAHPDHHEFTLAELLPYRHHPIIVTSKDAVKIRALLVAYTSEQALSDEYQALVVNLWVLPVTAVLSESSYDRLQQQLQTLGIDTQSIKKSQ